MPRSVSRSQVLDYRVHVGQLDVLGTTELTDVAALDLGVQDTGADGAGWALLNRGVAPEALARLGEELVLAWTLRGAPHFYRRREVAEVAAATAPFSEADAAKRILNAAKPLHEAGISPIDALDVVAAVMRDIARSPTVKGDMSAALTDRLDPPYLRHCRPCSAIHCFEQPFRLSALQAGLELRPGTSPPVLERIPGWQGPADTATESLDVVRAYLHLLGPATPQMVADYLDAPVRDVKQRWPSEAVEVLVGAQKRWLLAADLEALSTARSDPGRVRLLSPFDLFLQAKDRDLLVPDADRRKELWVVLGRPGAVLVGSEVVGTWRPRTSGRSLRLYVDAWAPLPHVPLAEQGERLAAYRGLSYAGLADK
jgi:hypothetical protein